MEREGRVKKKKKESRDEGDGRNRSEGMKKK